MKSFSSSLLFSLCLPIVHLSALLLPVAAHSDENVVADGYVAEAAQQQDAELVTAESVIALNEDTHAEQASARRQAKSIPLSEPVVVKPKQAGAEAEAAAASAAGVDQEKTSDVTESAAATQAAPAAPLVILNTEIPPGTSTRLSWAPSQSLEGIATPTPVLVVNGADEGPALCLFAAIHGDELNGIEIVRRVLYNLDPNNLAGTVIGVPIMNLQGFFRGSRYLADRRDLNRFFPGSTQGSSASRIAYSFFREVISHCDAVVDLHTGSFHRTNMPQLRADLRYPQIVELTQGFGGTVVLQSVGAVGSLRRAAVEAGIPAVTLEAGESMRLQEEAVEHGVNGITTLMSKMGMLERFSFWGDPLPVYYNSVWVRTEQGGILFSNVELSDTVVKGDLLGEVTDPITNIKTGIVSPHNGRVIGMALNQVVLPGYATFHIAIEAPKGSVKKTGSKIGHHKNMLIDGGYGEKGGESATEMPEDPDIMDSDGDMAEFPGDDNSD